MNIKSIGYLLLPLLLSGCAQKSLKQGDDTAPAYSPLMRLECVNQQGTPLSALMDARNQTVTISNKSYRFVEPVDKDADTRIMTFQRTEKGSTSRVDFDMGKTGHIPLVIDRAGQKQAFRCQSSRG